ncbi:MAG: thioredoxin [Clostridiales bacterium]|nr:thioredoxin [Clostridiales bacterium]
MAIIKIDKNNFENEALKSDKTMLLDFYADWCGPCRMVGPIVEEIAEEHPEYKVGKVNVDEQPELASAFSVMSIPALFVIKDGKIVNQALGAMTKEKILAMMRQE